MIFNRIDPYVLHRPLFIKSVDLVANCALRGAVYVATSGLRTHDQQNALYAQGRTTPGSIVTNAKGGQSLHNFGLALDFTFDKNLSVPGLQPSWNNDDYKILAEEAVKLGFEAGAYWQSIKDHPHIQYPIAKLGITLSDLEARYINGGLDAVYAHVGTFSW